MTLPRELQTVLFAVGHDRASSQSIGEIYVSGLARAIEQISDSVKRFIYVSSTGVYGQVASTEVDEQSPCQPTREGGRACLAAEQLLQGSRVSQRAIVLRLAGLYGPGRVPRAAEMAAGKPIDAPSDGWLNLIHVDDAARIVALADERAVPPRTYVVSDGQPIQRRDYYAEVARLLGAPLPQFVEPPADSPAAQRAASDKRVNPRRMLAELAPELVYPSYREGLAAILASTAS